ncbi:hypothetical protein, partial [Streptomyces sp. 5-10]|uniref:hypothetical protein n=1 Tax=Streptomyces sp. 5-10 TaxID=878925 RepID=UPI001988F9D1
GRSPARRRTVLSAAASSSADGTSCPARGATGGVRRSVPSSAAATRSSQAAVDVLPALDVLPAVDALDATGVLAALDVLDATGVVLVNGCLPALPCR